MYYVLTEVILVGTNDRTAHAQEISDVAKSLTTSEYAKKIKALPTTGLKI